MQKKNLVLVTGGGGYIGSVFIPSLIRQGFSVRVFDQFYFGLEPLQDVKDKVEVIKGDIRNIPLTVFDNVTSIIHLAGLSNDPTAEFNPQANFAINTNATIDIAKKAKKKGVKRFIFASTASVYSGPEKNIVKNEKHRVSPKAAYALSKLLAEKGIMELADDLFTVVILRKGTVFGFSPRMRYDLVVNMMVKSALQEGEIKLFNQGIQWRPLISLEDVVQAYIRTLKEDSQKINKQIFNISYGNYMVKDIAEKVQEVFGKQLGKHVNIVYDEGDKNDRSYQITNKKAKRLLHFIPQKSIEDVVVDIIESICTSNLTDFDNPIYYNIRHMKHILENE